MESQTQETPTSTQQGHPYPTKVEQWTHIIDKIFAHNPRIIQLRSTDHEFRTDDRNIESFGRFKKISLPIDSLPYNLDQKESKKVVDALLKYYWKYCNLTGEALPPAENDDDSDWYD